MASLREAFLELDDYLAKAAEKRYEEKLKEDGKDIDVGPAEARKRGRELLRPEDIDDQHRNLLRLRGGYVTETPTASAPSSAPTSAPEGKKPGAENQPLAGARPLLKPLGAFIYCGQAMDVGRAVQLAKDNGFLDRSVLVLGGECYKAVGELKRAGRPVVLPAELVYRETHPLTGDVKETFVPSVMHEAGLTFALVPGQDESYPERMLVYQAAQCVRAGIPREVALRSITLYPARMLGLESRLGSIEPGKDAHLVVFSGDPLDFNSVVERVFIAGIPAYDRSKDVRIQRLLTPGTEEGPQEKQK